MTIKTFGFHFVANRLHADCNRTLAAGKWLVRLFRVKEEERRNGFAILRNLATHRYREQEITHGLALFHGE